MQSLKYDVTPPSVFKKYYHYDPVSGEFTRLQFINGARGKPLQATYKSGTGLAVKIFDFSYPAHRAAWMYVNDRWPTADEQIIHKNGDFRDNRIENLSLFKKPKG